MIAKFLCFTFLLLVSFHEVKAQIEAAVLSNINVSNGLPSNSVTSIVQDKYGFIWMGTFNGLSRYDGFSFKTYRNKWQDSLSLVNNHVVTIGTTNSGIWAGTLMGISFFDFARKNFRTYQFWNQVIGREEDLDARCSNVFTSGDMVFLGTEDKGFLVLMPGSDSFTRVPYGKMMDYNVQGICQYKGVIYMFVKDVGLCRYNRQKKHIELVSNLMTAGGKLFSNPENGIIYIGSQNGLFEYKVANQQILESRYNRKLLSGNITSLLFDRDGNLWIATDGGGVSIFNTKSNGYKHITSGHSNGQLRSDAVYAVFEDKNSRKWLATLRGGISIVGENNLLFKSIRNDPNDANSLISNFTLSFCEDDEKKIWIGTDGGGLSVWNPVNNHFRNYVHKLDNVNSLSSNFVVSLLSDYKGRIWIATFGGGLQLFDKRSQRFIRYPTYNPALKEYEVNFWKLFQDKRHRLWAGATRGGALYLFNEKRNIWELFDSNLTNIHAISEDKENNLWIGNFHELIKVDHIEKKQVRYEFGFPVLCIYNDSQDRLWLGSNGGGLALFDKNTLTFKHFTESEGLPGNTVLNILEDDDGFLWFSSYNGLTKFNSQTEEFTNFSVEDGLQSNEFSYNAALRLSDGKLMFGGIEGFNVFDPHTIRRKQERIPSPIITHIGVNKTPIELTRYRQDGLPVEDMDNIKLPFRDANLDIDFVSISYSAHDEIKYAYFLKGWDKNWNYTTSEKLTYNNLREGDYKLFVKARSSTGGWTTSTSILHITILPPWYRSWWAWVIYLSVGALMIYVYIRYKVYKNRLKYELDLANIRVQDAKELGERKVAFFTNISHEFRTLLTLIINPITELMRNADDESKPEEIKVAYNNSRRMLQLVDQLLLFRKANADATELKVGKYNLYDLCKDVFDSFYYQAKAADISYEFIADNQDLQIYVDIDKIEIVLFNLLSNALKFTPRGGSVKLEIKEETDFAAIAISDSGPGIDSKIGNKLFNPYFQVKTLEAEGKPGFGIGLYLVKNYVDLHKGELYYESELGLGTTFHIELLKGASHFPDNTSFVDRPVKNQVANEIFEKEVITAATRPAANPGEIISGKKTILLVDDNKELLGYLSSIFSNQYNVLVSLNAENAFEIVLAKKPDIVITDLSMPGNMDGFQLCSKIKDREEVRHIPVILITGKGSDEMRVDCFKCGAEDFILKPFDKDLLLAKVRNLIASKENLKQYFLNHVTLYESNLSIAENDKLFLDECIKIVDEHLYDKQFTIAALAKEMGKSHSTLYKKIKELSGYTANSFVRMVRLRKAAELLINSNCNVTEAATQVGFNDMKNFRIYFRDLFHCSPSQYKKQYRGTFQKKYTINK